MSSYLQSLKPGKSFTRDLVAGFSTGLFSIPEGMAYAQLASVNPIYGLYSGMVATLVAALSTSTILMISTLTSAIALSTASDLSTVGIDVNSNPNALFMITLGPSTLAFCGEASLDEDYLDLLSNVAAGGPDGAGGLALETTGGAQRMLFTS